eukprot:786348-Amphidinium_carterae.1
MGGNQGADQPPHIYQSLCLQRITISGQEEYKGLEGTQCANHAKTSMPPNASDTRHKMQHSDRKVAGTAL